MVRAADTRCVPIPMMLPLLQAGAIGTILPTALGLTVRGCIPVLQADTAACDNPLYIPAEGS